MTITKRPAIRREIRSPDSDPAQTAFIAGGADGGRQGALRGRRVQISHTLPPTLLAAVDAQARKKGLTRAGLINLVLSEFLEGR